ncbi:DUF935 domain-containing protein [Puniceibacterium sp. HSS470]|nr:DUF935 domain-containing protein [Puniceibacterium sp. HSS470]|tara:strand:- start:14108 stop:15679 length:1572 start_codon:yes stop_codon:yes gene_type:complete
MALLDQWGRPMQMPKRADMLDQIAQPTLGSVRQIHSGHPADGLDPIRLTAILRAAETGDATSYLEMAEQMEEKDLHYAAVLGVRKRAIRSLEMRVEPGDDSDAAKDAAEIVRKALGSAAIKEDLIDMLDALGKGYSVTEILWQYANGAWEVAGLEQCDPRWFEYDQVTGRRLMMKDNAGPMDLQPFKFIVHQARAKSGLPIRGGLARLAAWAYMFKNFSIRDWAIFCEAYGHPLRLGKYDTSASAEDRRTLLRAVRQIGVDMAAIVPKSMEIEIVAASGTGADKLYEGNARYWDEQISKGILGQVATTDAIAGGHAVGKIHEEVRGDIRDADAEQLAATLMRDVALPLTVLRFGDARRVPVPRIRFLPPERIDPADMLELVKVGPQRGLRIAVKDVRKTFNLSEPEDGEEILMAAPPDSVTNPKTPPSTRELAARDVTPEPDEGDALDALVDELLAEGMLQEVVEDGFADLLEALGKARSLEQVQDLISTFASDADPAKLQELLTRSSFTARVAGEVGAPIED